MLFSIDRKFQLFFFVSLFFFCLFFFVFFFFFFFCFFFVVFIIFVVGLFFWESHIFVGRSHLSLQLYFHACPFSGPTNLCIQTICASKPFVRSPHLCIHLICVSTLIRIKLDKPKAGSNMISSDQKEDTLQTLLTECDTAQVC